MPRYNPPENAQAAAQAILYRAVVEAMDVLYSPSSRRPVRGGTARYDGSRVALDHQLARALDLYDSRALNLRAGE